MAEKKENHWLIVEPSPAADERLDGLLPRLGKIGLDPYTARQRLIGRAPALLARGKKDALEKVALLLCEYRFSTAVIDPAPPRFTPHRLYGLAHSDDGIVFDCGGGRTVRLPRGGTVTAVLADLSGTLVDKSLRRLLGQNAYRGADAVEGIEDDESCRIILRGAPVLDLYLLSEGGEAAAAVRVFPGKFDPRGLKKKGSLSAAGNLKAVLDLARECAGSFTLHTGFGLASLPGCQLAREEGEADARRKNLAALTRFGWLMIDLRRAHRRAPSAAAPSGPVPVPSSTGEPAPPSAEGQRADTRSRPRLPFPLPPPPEVPEAAGNRFGRERLAFLGAAAGSLASLAWLRGDGALEFLIRYGWKNGALPAVLSVGCFWAGSHSLRVKRRIENTPTSRIRSLALGMVEVRGRALRRYALVSPMSATPCVWYRLTKYRRDRGAWRQRSTMASGSVPFVLQDATGRVGIDPRGAAIRCRTRNERFFGGGESALDAEEKWVEELLCEGSSVYALGFARDGRRGVSLRQRTLEGLRRLKGDPEALRRYDTDGDGRLSESEWEAARAAVEERALQESLAQPSAPSPREDAVVIGRPLGRALPFVLAETGSEEALRRRFGSLAAALLAAGLILAVTAAVLFLGKT